MSSFLGDAVAAALGSVRASLPELAHTMSADGLSATVILASSVNHGLDAASSAGAAETRTYVAQVVDFPDLELESLVELDEVPHLITSLKSTGTAAWFVGVSDEMATTETTVRGTRRERATVHPINTTIPALVCKGGDGKAIDGLYAHAAADTFYVVIRERDWNEPSAPDTGDELSFCLDGIETTAVVAKAERHKGYYLLNARGR